MATFASIPYLGHAVEVVQEEMEGEGRVEAVWPHYSDI